MSATTRGAEVLRWLEANLVPLGEPPAPGQKLGARYLWQYRDFEGATSRSLCNMVYLLPHTMVHQMIHIMAECSRLELGSLGECIYPADLAFVVYRSALTPDLGKTYYASIALTRGGFHRGCCNRGWLSCVGESARVVASLLLRGWGTDQRENGGGAGTLHADPQTSDFSNESNSWH